MTVIAWVAWAAAALAQDGGESNLSGCSMPFTRKNVRTLVDQSTAALSRDDALSHKRLWDEFESRVGCLDHQIEDDAWAELLLNQALVLKATDQEWQRTLDTALRAYPDLDVPDFLRKEYRPEAKPTPSGVTIPDDAVLFVDGVLSPTVPVLEGDHVVQVWRDGRFRSAFLEPGDQVPTDWLVPKPKEVVEVVKTEERFVPRPYAMGGVVLGPTIGRQLVQDPGEFLGDQQEYGGQLGVATSGAVPLTGPAGVFWDATLPFLVPSVRQGTDQGFQPDDATVLPEAWLGAVGVFQELTAGIGGGVSTLLHYEGEVPVRQWYPQPHLFLGLRQARRDFEIASGLTPSALHGAIRLGFLLTDPKPVTLRLGVDTHLGVAWLTEADPGDRHATAVQWSLLGRLDVVWGRDR